MKKLYHFKKINSGCLLLKKYFSEITLILISLLVLNIAALNINAQDAVTGAFQGKVVDKSTSKPISGAIVTIRNETHGFEYSLLTDKDGEFYQSLLPPGLYTIQIAAAGYQSLEITARPLFATKVNEIIPLPALEPIGAINSSYSPRIAAARTKPLPKATSTNPRKTPGEKPNNSSTTSLPLIAGDLAVASVSGAEIIVKHLERNQSYKNKILSGEMLCVFNQLPVGKYKVSASLEGYKPEEKEIEIRADQTMPLTLNLTPNETSSRIFSQVGKYYALIIGNNNYIHLPKLKTAVEDAKAVDKILRDKFGFETKLLLNATREQIIVALNEYRRIGENDNLVIYYAGHGFNDTEVEKAYWLPVDARTEDNANWISADDITTNVKKLNARHVLIVADSCYSGTISRGSDLVVLGAKPTEREKYLLKMSDGKSRTLMASGGNEPVTDGGGGLYSVFAAALLIGILDMEKDIFTAEELYISHIKEKVAGKAAQTPEYNPLRNSGHEGGDFVFIRKK